MTLLKFNNWMAKEMSLLKLKNWMAKDMSLLEFNNWMAKEMSLLKFNNWMAKEMSLLKVNNWMAKEMSLLKFVYYKKLSIPNYIALRPTQDSSAKSQDTATKDTHLRVLGNLSWALFVYMPCSGHWCCLMEPCLKEQIVMAKHY